MNHITRVLTHFFQSIFSNNTKIMSFSIQLFTVNKIKFFAPLINFFCSNKKVLRYVTKLLVPSDWASFFKLFWHLDSCESSYGVKVAHGTLNPLVGVRFAVGARFLFIHKFDHLCGDLVLTCDSFLAICSVLRGPTPQSSRLSNWSISYMASVLSISEWHRILLKIFSGWYRPASDSRMALRSSPIRLIDYHLYCQLLHLNS